MNGSIDDLRDFTIAYLRDHPSSTVSKMSEQLDADEYGYCRAERLRYALKTLERDGRVVRLGRTHATHLDGSMAPGPRPWLWGLP